MLKTFITLGLYLCNVVFGQERFTSAERKEFFDDIKESMAEEKVKNKGRIDLQILKVGLYSEIEAYLDQKKITNDEAVRIKQNYENFARTPGLTIARVEGAYIQFVQQELEKINRTPVEKVGEGAVCNQKSCTKGLSCVPDPNQKSGGRGNEAGATCKDSSECASRDCIEGKNGSNKKICEEVFRCFRPLGIGESCANNPVCGAGKCLPFNILTSGIGECEVRGKRCSKNSDCCSDLCSGGVCKENKICKDCQGNGSLPTRGQVCCEGLYLNEKGMCAPDVPPSVIPQVRILSTKSVLTMAMNIFIASAGAEEVATVLSAKDAVKKANKEMKEIIKVDKELYSNFKAKSDKGEALDASKAKANLVFSSKKTDFNTCDIHFREDYYNELIKKKTFDLHAAMMGFGFVMLGDADNDYWRSGGTENTSLYSRLKSIAQDHQNIRKTANQKIDEINDRLTCMCLDVQGLANIKSEAKKSFFTSKCDEYKNAQSVSVSTGELNYSKLSGDASGLKAKMLLTVWTEKLDEFYMSLTTENEKTSSKISNVSKWVNEEAKWSEARHREYELFKFNIKQPSYSTGALGALTSALLAAGVIAILGGFATTSILSAWGAAGIIAASAVTGAGGMWMMASLKGAWITKNPEIIDTNQRGYNCGKNESCVEYTRVLKQPYNDVCKIHASANSCIVNFVGVNEGEGQPSYIVDPWVPWGLSKSMILTNSTDGNYAQKLDHGFEVAKAEMLNRNPGAGGGNGGKGGGGRFVSEDYLTDIFIDAEIVGKYTPALGASPETDFDLTEEKIQMIKEAAKKFAVEEKFLAGDDKENAVRFGDYAYKYHFLWPKKSLPNEISYPTMGLSTYLSYMANDVAGAIAASAGNSRNSLGKLRANYLEDFKRTLQVYKDNHPTDVEAINKEIGKVDQKLEALRDFNALVDGINLSSQLGKNGGLGLSQKSGLSGAGLSSSQKDFLNAIGNLRKARQSQLIALGKYKEAMAANGNAERAKKMIDTNAKFQDKFTNGLSGAGNGPLSTLGNSSKNNNSASGDGLLNSGDKLNEFGNQGNNSNTETAAGAGSLYGWGVSAGAKGSNSNSGISEADRSKIVGAIEERDKLDKNQYQSNEKQSLFEKLTNAYIRNYERVLTEKVDKDAIE